MNYERACFLLDIHDDMYDTNGEMNVSLLKKQYHKMALKHHPDKNPHDTYATHHFQEIQDAYQFLLKYVQSPQTTINEPTTFKSMMRVWLEEYLHSGAGKHQLLIILSKLASMAETAGLDYLTNIEVGMLEKVAEFAKLHQDVFHLSDTFLQKLDALVAEKRADVKVVTLNPTLDDLLNQHLYKMHYGGEVFVIPVWHSVLEYDLSGGRTMWVECYPILPEYVRIDEHNNLHVDLEFDLGEIWDKTAISFTLGQSHTYHLYPSTQLNCISQQQVVLKHCGIPEIQMKRMYDASVLRHIYVNIHIHYPHLGQSPSFAHSPQCVYNDNASVGEIGGGGDAEPVSDDCETDTYSDACSDVDTV